MRKFLAGFAVFFSLQTIAMSTVVRQANRVNPRNRQLCLNTPRNFGTTHFIRGYKHKPKISSISQQAVPIINEPAPIINGSSAHLIDPTCHTQLFFSSTHHITSIILDVIKHAQKDITLAIYTLTEKNVAHELIAAHDRGVKVCIFADKGKMQEKSSKIPDLVKKGVPVFWYDCSLRDGYQKNNWVDPLLHHKLMVVDDLAVTGSANLTDAAQRYNMENIVLLRYESAVKSCCQEFARLKKLCVACK
jgi:phosphatidylserine/phosphatidylglycerophosphate/cardiolipin synthase-like enzyme